MAGMSYFREWRLQVQRPEKKREKEKFDAFTALVWSGWSLEVGNMEV